MMDAHEDGLQTITATVHTAGRSRDASHIDLTREMPSTGPASLPAGGGMVAGTGSLTIEDPETAVQARRTSPWYRDRGWPPALGDPVVIEVETDGDSSRRFTGIVEDAAGNSDGPVDVQIVDPVDQLHHKVGFEPLANPMPIPSRDGEADGVHYRINPYLRTEHHITTAMRAAGFHTVPPPAAAAALWVPLTGSTLAARGRQWRQPLNPPDAAWREVAFWPGRLGLRHWTGEYEPDPDAPAPMRYDYHLVVHLARFSTGRQTISLSDTKSFPGRIAVLDLQYIGGGTQLRIRLAVSELNIGQMEDVLDTTIPWDTATPYLRLVTQGDVSTVYHGDTEIWSGGPARGGGSDRPIETLAVASTTGTGITFGPTYLGRASDGDPVQWDGVNAHLIPSPLLTNELTATPFIPQTDAINVLRSIAAATMADMWIDEAGHLHWAGVGVLATREPTLTLTAEADLLDVAWEETISNMAREVSLRCDTPAVSVPNDSLARVHLWSGAGEDMEPGDVVTEWASPPDDEDWLAVRWPPQRSSLIVPIYSQVGGSISQSSGAPTNAGTADLAITSEQINSQTYRFTHAASTALQLRSRNYGSQARNIDQPLPRIHGRGRIQWAENIHTAAKHGPPQAADYEHPAGPWVQGADCQTLADWIAAWVTAPGALLRDLPIIYRPDLQLGQVVDVIEDAVYHIHVRAIIVGIHETHAPGSSEMTVTLRVLALDQQPATLATYDQVWAGETLAARDQEWAGQTLAEFDANPLRRV